MSNATENLYYMFMVRSKRRIADGVKLVVISYKKENQRLFEKDKLSHTRLKYFAK